MPREVVTANSRGPMASNRAHTASRGPTASNRARTANSRDPIANSRAPTVNPVAIRASKEDMASKDSLVGAVEVAAVVVEEVPQEE
eukprot:g16629.t1